jgi:hypothetical protein
LCDVYVYIWTQVILREDGENVLVRIQHSTEVKLWSFIPDRCLS